MLEPNNFTTWALPPDALARFGKGQVLDLAVSSDGKYLAVGSWAGAWWYELSTGTPLTLCETERGMIDCIALCPAEKPWLAISNSDRHGAPVVKVWDVQTGECVSVLAPLPKPICDFLCFSSSSGEWVAAVAEELNTEFSIYIWNAATGTLHAELNLPIADIPSHSYDDLLYFATIGAVAFSPNNRLLAGIPSSRALDNAERVSFISVWDTTVQEHISLLTDDTEVLHSLCFSPTGQLLATGGAKGSVKVWDVSTWQLHQTYPSRGDYLMNVSYASDGTLRVMGVSHDECTVTVWDVEQQKELSTFQGKIYFDGEIQPTHFSSGAHLALKIDSEVQVKSVSANGKLFTLPWDLGYPHSLTFSADGKTLACGYRNFGGVMLYDRTTHHSQQIAVEPMCETHAVFSDATSGKLYTTGFPPTSSEYWGDTLTLWEIGQSEPIAELPPPVEHPEKFGRYSMAYSPITNLLACGNETNAEDLPENDPENGAVYVWDVARGQMQHIFRGKHTDSVGFVRFSPDGTRLISRDTDGTDRVWDVTCSEEIVEFPENFMKHGVFDYARYEAEYEALAERFEEVYFLSGFRPQVFSSCGNLIAGAFSDDKILVWDIERCEARVTIHKPLTVSRPPSVDPIELSPCGRYLAYGEVWEEGVKKVPVRLWDISTGENIATFRGHPTDIQCLAFSPDSTVLASGSFDGTILLWDLTPYLSHHGCNTGTL